MSPKLTFGQALEALKSGGKARRAGWPSGWRWLELRLPEEEGGGAVLFVKFESEQYLPWSGCDFDLLAEDWEVVG